MRSALIALTLLLASPAVAQTPPPYSERGPHAVINRQEGPGCHTFRPKDLGGTKRPVILWGNGTNTGVAVYSPMLVQWASHGFIVAAAMTGNAGTGKEMLGCLDYLAKENEREGSVYEGMVDLAHVGATGHSQGGTGAIMAGRDPRVVTTAPIQPYTQGSRYQGGAEGKQNGPMLLLSGSADQVAGPMSNQKPVFDGANVPVVWATLLGAGHSTPSSRQDSPYRYATTAWFLWQLQGDQKAGAMFNGSACGYCTNADWSLQKKGVD